MTAPSAHERASARWWQQDIDTLFADLSSGPDGLSSAEALRRLTTQGPNTLDSLRRSHVWWQLLRRFTDPLVLILIVAAVISLALGEWIDASIVIGIVVLTTLIGFIQERRGSVAVDALRARVGLSSRVLRDGALVVVPAIELVSGDVISLSAGDLVPADARVIDANACFVEEAMLTGETLPAEKHTGAVVSDASHDVPANGLYMGSSIRSGVARAVIVETGIRTRMGALARRLSEDAADTDFERGLRQFGGLLMRVMLTVVIMVLAINIILQRPDIDTLLFAAALAVGLSPELLPAILAITLSRGARRMASAGVIVKRLNAIENLGSMQVLCTDKTGTLTQGVMSLDRWVDADDTMCGSVLRWASLNASLQAGMRNPLDDAIVERATFAGLDLSTTVKLDEIPYDFVSRRLSVVVPDPACAGGARLICKGAVGHVMPLCTAVLRNDEPVLLTAVERDALLARCSVWGGQGYRVLAVAVRSVDAGMRHDRDSEVGLSLAGFLLFFDPPDPQVSATLASLRALQVEVKIISGDNRHVTRHVADTIGMPVTGHLLGEDLQDMSDDALSRLVQSVSLFSEIDPHQKARIIRALQQAGMVVGYLGDGINDAPALRVADVGISVHNAADVAREAADFVLLEHDLDVLRQGIDEGRHTFANTLKYLFITTSANFGNMISMAMASLFLPFLPLLAKQVLLNNFLSDVPAMGIAADNVDREWEKTPHRWDIRLVRNAMITFGLTSTVFDLLTFAVLWSIAGGDEVLFRTGWFLESLLTELLVLFMLRTSLPFYRSRPGRFLLWSSVVICLVAVWLPFSPVAGALGFQALPPDVLGAILAITVAYALVTEYVKAAFFRRHPASLA